MMRVWESDHLSSLGWRKAGLNSSEMCDRSCSLPISQALSDGRRKEKRGSLCFSSGPQTLTQTLYLLSLPSFHSIRLQGGHVPIHRSAPSRADSSHSCRQTCSPFCVPGTEHSPEHRFLWTKPFATLNHSRLSNWGPVYRPLFCSVRPKQRKPLTHNKIHITFLELP